MSEFTHVPDYAAALSRQPRVRSARFGDGYEQRLGDGINTDPQLWQLSFSARNETEADAIEAFFVAKGATTAFTWTPPGKAEIKVVCRHIERVYRGRLTYDLAMTFEEVFEP